MLKFNFSFSCVWTMTFIKTTFHRLDNAMTVLPTANIGLNAIFILRVGTGVQAVELFNYFRAVGQRRTFNPAK